MGFGQIITTTKRNETAVQGIPTGKLNDLDLRLKALEANPAVSGYTGGLYDSTNTLIATVEDGLIKTVVFIPAGGALLLEDGFYLLLESGDKLLLE
jgi:hypothetical protein